MHALKIISVIAIPLMMTGIVFVTQARKNQPAATAAEGSIPEVNTFSIVAYDPETGDLGIAVASKVLGVGCIVPWGKAGRGAIATQSAANTAYGPDGLELLKDKSAEEVVRVLTSADEGRAIRQLGIVDAQGRAASFTGEKCNAWAGHIVGEHFTVQGNLLAGEKVLQDMAAKYREAREQGDGELADWLMAALIAGDDAGGDRRGKQSAALMVYRQGAGYGGNDRYIDLRVDDHQQPVTELARLLNVHKTFFAGAHRRVKAGAKESEE
ncbi:hypothetical protein Pan97_25090 [Bremerella volcania]|uniref:Peptidoglycan binding domain protein n=1 Tax=Bremerella volcania TaxID=2527984 RepID=A0A518C8B8_9BACT|nr:DUF1028 domain-containing protein [Bremerella volcania]QDU75476.1 hypothetical protein Pan97_25090 [Bremerella volcania]